MKLTLGLGSKAARQIHLAEIFVRGPIDPVWISGNVQVGLPAAPGGHESKLDSIVEKIDKHLDIYSDPIYFDRKSSARSCALIVITPLRSVFSCDLRTLALFRVCLGFLIIADLWSRSRELVAHYSDQGVLPRSALTLIEGYLPTSLYMISGSAVFVGLLFLLAAIAAFLVIIGYRARLMVFISWVFFISLDARNSYVSQGGDLLLQMLLFWSIFLPVSKRFSVDAALDSSPVADNQHFSLASLGLLIQVLSVYFFTALMKDDPVWIPDGTAVYYALNIDPLVSPVGEWLREFPFLMKGLTYFVWGLEIVAPLLVFSPIFHVPLRLVGLSLLILMHIGFLVCMYIGFFPLISITSLLVLTPGVVWNWLGRRVESPARAGIRIYFDGDCLFCEKVCLILRSLLILPNAQITAAQSREDVEAIMRKHDSWVVYDHEGNHHLRWKGLAWLFSQSPLFSMLGTLMGWSKLQGLGDRIYGLIAANRYRFGRLTRILLPFRPLDTSLNLAASAMSALFITITLWHNLSTIRQIDVPVPSAVRMVLNNLRLNQSWTMFAPRPSDTYGWYIAEGMLRDGRSVDVYLDVDGKPVGSREAYLEHNYANYRWRKYLTELPLEERVESRPYYLHYLCREWNEKHTDSELSWIKLYFVAEKIPPPGAAKTSERILTWQSNCIQDPAAELHNLRRGILPVLGQGV